MADQSEKTTANQILDYYRSFISQSHPDVMPAWPILSGCNNKTGSFNGWLIVIFEHTGATACFSYELGEMSAALIGVSQIDASNKSFVRSRLEKHFGVKPADAVVFVDQNRDLQNELELMKQKHEYSMGITPMKIFLSHMGIDKPFVRKFKNTLELLGFDCWLDEDAMSAGTELERGLLKGLSDSCAAVFFITPEFVDENYLASEIDYAIQEKRRKEGKFSIVTLVFKDSSKEGIVPNLLRRYVWKNPSDDLEALREIIKALPIQVGNVYWRN